MKYSPTQDVHHGEAVVEGDADEEPAEAEGREVVDGGGGDATQEPYDVGPHQGWYPAVPVGQPAEDEPAEDGAHEEDGLGYGRQR